MKLPNIEKAVVADEKILNYLLDITHPDGGPKAAFFFRFGFSREHWETLRDELLTHAATYTVSSQRRTSKGMNYVIIGPIQTPDERNPIVCVIWCMLDDEDFPRLVSAYPA